MSAEHRGSLVTELVTSGRIAPACGDRTESRIDAGQPVQPGTGGSEMADQTPGSEFLVTNLVTTGQVEPPKEVAR